MDIHSSFIDQYAHCFLVPEKVLLFLSFHMAHAPAAYFVYQSLFESGSIYSHFAISHRCCYHALANLGVPRCPPKSLWHSHSHSMASLIYRHPLMCSISCVVRVRPRLRGSISGIPDLPAPKSLGKLLTISMSMIMMRMMVI